MIASFATHTDERAYSKPAHVNTLVESLDTLDGFTHSKPEQFTAKLRDQKCMSYLTII